MIYLRRTALLVALATPICAGLASNVSATLPSVRTPPVSASAVKTNSVGQFLIAQSRTQEQYYRLQLKQGGQYLDADHCSTTIGLNPGSDYAGGACQLWRFVPAGGGWNRLQLKQGGQYLDAAYCSTKIGLNPGSDYASGACQLWRLVPAGNGWNRLQLKSNSQYLDAAYCSNTISLNPGSDYASGACQLWRLVPASRRID
ncbi:MAG: RICIN domain-containing protein [Phormidesmis sp. CAN_BIN44]|nr:RICIN domain-containing protein [Phormidesmis sp. CAN_BIN44]